MSEAIPPAPDDRVSGPASAQASSAVVQWVARDAASHGFTLDAAQTAALGHFERLYDDLIGLEHMEASLIRRLTRRRLVKGLYLWSGVGRGKSFLMDSFYSCAPVARKRRVHFHRFMQEVHHGLRRVQGQADPLFVLARELARKTRLMCLDEFHVTDITDAMLMRRLLEGLFEQGVVLVTTSNFEPDALYLHGLQRSQFLPAIDLIKQCLDVVAVDGGVDYRLRELEKAGVYHAEPDSDSRLEQAYCHLVGRDASGDTQLEIEGRLINVRRESPGVAWFEFPQLCEGPRAKADYIELARRYHTVLLSGVPRFSIADADRLRRFVWLVDEFYDRRVKLIIAAAAPAAELVDGTQGRDSFQANLNASLKERLVSRLTEMQTRDYLSRPHLP
jgi:cell division protein ZapE